MTSVLSLKFTASLLPCPIEMEVVVGMQRKAGKNRQRKGTWASYSSQKERRLSPSGCWIGSSNSLKATVGALDTARVAEVCQKEGP